MSAIVPAVLPKTRKELEDALRRFASIDGVDAVQIDVVDGEFATPKSWPYAEGGKDFAQMVAANTFLPHAGRLRFEVDLMVRDPELVTGAWIAVGASRITVHAESTTYLPRVITDLRLKYGHDKDFAPGLLSLGLAVNLTSDLSLIEPFLPFIEYVQFMGIAQIGRQGEPFDRRVLTRIRSFKKRYPEMTIQIDGGVTEQTAPELLAAGANRLVVGHELLQAKDMNAKFRTLSKMVEQYGTYE